MDAGTGNKMIAKNEKSPAGRQGLGMSNYPLQEEPLYCIRK